MALQKNKKDLNKEDEETKQVTNNNVFVGSTTDLQRLLQKENERILDHAEDKE